MTKILSVWVLLLAGSLAWAQSTLPKPVSLTNTPNDMAAELDSLREALTATQKQVATQQEEIQQLKQQLKNVTSTPVAEQAAGLTRSSSTLAGPVAVTGESGSPAATAPLVAQTAQTTPQPVESTKPSPLSFRIGGAEFTPGGFVDFENIFRTTNTQNNIATNFAAIPFNNSPQGNLTEFRTTGQYSRISLKVAGKFGRNDVTGYVESDFSGNDATNVYQSVNGHTLRLRLYFMDLKRAKWEFMGGQTWSWLVPNRQGVGPMPPDLALTYNEDQNIEVGLPFTRAAEFRVAYHFNDHWAMGVGIENPNQFIGGFVALPAAFSNTVSPQFDNGAQIGAPNAFPDVISKVAYDTKFRGGRHFHAEITGMLTGARVAVVPKGLPSFRSHKTVGGGGTFATNFDLRPGFRFLAHGFWSDGGAHYLVGTGPQAVVRPNAAGTDVTASMVHAGAGNVGLELDATKKTTLGAYVGGDYFQRNFFPDTTTAARPIIGYGGPGSPNTNNRTIQQATLDWLQTIWKQPNYGTLMFYTQYSYLTRSPWFVPRGGPRNAHLSMVYLGFRYVLP